jgi:hypothetical protein
MRARLVYIRYFPNPLGIGTQGVHSAPYSLRIMIMLGIGQQR